MVKKKNEEVFTFPSASSINPSYSRLALDYDVVCRQRITESKKKYDTQFLYELKMQEAMQQSAYDAMRFHRHFVITTLWPPLHTRKEIDYVLSKMFNLSPKLRTRVNHLVEEDQN